MTKVTEKSEVKSSYGIVNAILNRLGLTDKGQLEKFYNKEVKTLKRDIKALKQNINVEESNFETKEEEINEQIEDANEYIRDAYLAVKIEDITNNKAIENFKNLYWNNIDNREKELTQLKETLLLIDNQTKTNIDQLKADIKLREGRISKIMSFK